MTGNSPPPTLRERGMPIMRETGCKVGAHVWTWYGTSGGELNYDPDRPCLCGLVTWREAHRGH